ncbi:MULTISPECIES: hypothetical protein [Asaia]|uniref:hypothetical protein n=1 Tax=Asaia TaxID=91914 RepID=UPI002FC35E1A
MSDKNPIRSDIRMLANEICAKAALRSGLAHMFCDPFTKLDDSRSKSIIPNAMKEGLRNVFSSNIGLDFYDEMTIEIPGLIPGDPNFPDKLIDYVVVQPKTNRCIVIELKTNMGFDGYAAALVEFMLLHSTKGVFLTKKGPNLSRTQVRLLVDRLDILHVVCSVNFPNSIEKWAPLLTRSIPLPEMKNDILMFAPFRRVSGKLPTVAETSDYVETFLAGLLHWLDTGAVPVTP